MDYNQWYCQRFLQGKTGEIVFNLEFLLFYLTYCFLYTSKKVKKSDKELAIAEKLVLRAYNQGRLTLLIDALDEAPKEEIKKHIVACVEELFKAFPGKQWQEKENRNRVYLTSRYSEQEKYFTGKLPHRLEPIFEVRALDMEQLRQMARYFYGDNTPIYQEFDEIVWQEEIAAKVGGTPLTALLVIAYYEIFRKFDTRFCMYNIIVIFILVRVWKQIKDKHFNKNMISFFKEARSKKVLKEEKNAKEIYDALTLLSFEHIGEGRIMNEEDILGIFEMFAAEVERDCPEDEEAEQWFERMKEDHLFVSAGPKEYVFIHSTMMEYLAARYIVERFDNPSYLEKKSENKDLKKNLAARDSSFLAAEIIPIAVGSSIKTGTRLLRFIREWVRDTTDKEKKALLFQLALKSLAEFESFIDCQYRRKRLEILHRKMEKEIQENWDAVEWIYKYLGRIVLTDNKGRLNAWGKAFKNISRLTRPYFLEKYLDYENFYQGDSEIVALRDTTEQFGVYVSPRGEKPSCPAPQIKP